MTFSIDHSRSRCLLWLSLPLLVGTGCARLAPGIAPLVADPPATASYGLTDTLGDEAIAIESEESLEQEAYVDAASDAATEPDAVDGEAAFSVDEGEPRTADLENGELLSTDDDGGQRYIARQYPRTYPAPPPPSSYSISGNGAAAPPSSYASPQPPSVYQLPRGYQAPANSSAALQSPTYQPPQNLPLPSNGVPLVAPQAPPVVNPAPPQTAPVYQTPAGVLPAPVPFGEYGVSPSDLPPPLTDGYGSPIITSPPIDPYSGVPGAPPTYIPNTRTADLEITGYPARTGRIMFGGAVNSDAGVTGQITVDERNFDITRFPRSFQDLASGTAFRGAGQTLRLEAVPGSQFKRYTASFADPNLFGYLPVSFGLSGFLYDRRYQDYDEERLGGRISLGYRVTPDLSLTTGINGQNVEISNPRITGVNDLDRVLGDNDLYTGEVRLTHDTRNSPFQASEGHFFEFAYEKAFGEFDYSRYEIENRNYLLLAERADGSGKQTVSLTTRLGFSGDDTPLFENYFAGGYSTMRGFDFRGASPVESGVQVGGRFQWLNSVEYMFPITADDAFRGVAFVDFGTVERDIEIHRENFRVAPGVGLRVSIPMLGPAPLAFDFAYPVEMADTDDRRIFSFYMSTLR